MKHHNKRLTAITLAIAVLIPTTHLTAAPDPNTARKTFREAKAICQRDNAKFWGISLCGPMFLTDWQDYNITANQADAEGKLKREGDLWVGQISEEVIIADTPTEWSGTRWTQLVPPLPEDKAQRHVKIAHELFHRIQGQLGLDRHAEGLNRHLDTLDGRYYMQLEWRALAAALQANGSEQRNAAIMDAIAFRQQRYHLFTNAGDEEAMLEVGEGVPEYTGVMLGLKTDKAREAFAVYDLGALVEAKTFVRSFAYATGAAWGILLDRVGADWQQRIGQSRFDKLMLEALAQPEPSLANIEERASQYDAGGKLLAKEKARDEKQRQMLAGYRQRLITGPVLILPLDDSSFQFNPQTITPLAGVGMIYPTMGLGDAWGTLAVASGGVLIHDNPRQATVSTNGIADDYLSGDGWTLKLAPGWVVVQGSRKGDLQLQRTVVTDTEVKK